MVGGARLLTVRVAVLLPDPAVAVCVVVSLHVALPISPGCVLVMLKVTVQLLLAGILIPVKLSAVAPDVKVFGVVPVQLPPTAPPAALMLTRLSVNAPPDRADALLLESVTVTVDVPPD